MPKIAFYLFSQEFNLSQFLSSLDLVLFCPTFRPFDIAPPPSLSLGICEYVLSADKAERAARAPQLG